jgi:hypothetical protein
MTATPTTMLMMAVKILLASGAGWVNGAAAAITSARAVIQAKNAKGRGVPSSSICSSVVARRAAPAARSAYTAVAEFPKLLAVFGASTGMPRTPRVVRTPASTASAATTAVATPPAHNRPAFK